MKDYNNTPSPHKNLSGLALIIILAGICLAMFSRPVQAQQKQKEDFGIHQIFQHFTPITQTADIVPTMLDHDLNQWNQMRKPCDERERILDHMMVDLNCFNYTPSELGFDCDSILLLGSLAELKVYAVWQSWNGQTWEVWADPTTDSTANNIHRPHHKFSSILEVYPDERIYLAVKRK